VPRLAVYLLGPPRVELDGAEVRIPRRKALALLAYMSVTGRTHSRDALATFLWPEYDQSSAHAELRRILSSLNRTIGHQWLVVDRETAALDVSAGAWIDVQAFEQAVAACAEHDPPPGTPCPDCVRRLSDAAALYADDFLSGFALPDSEPFDDWQRLESQSLRAALTSALDRLADGYIAQGDHDKALHSAQRWLSLDPLDEAAHRALMALYAQAGQRPAALRQYRQCVRTLERELGVEPSPETTALYQQIRDAQGPMMRVTSPAAPEQRMPAFLDTESSDIPEPIFVGRERELARLETFLDAALAGQGGIAFVTGEAGEGKTALLRAFARRASAVHPDLLVARGNCNAYSGFGDPYLPFRELLATLTGDAEASWRAGAISLEQARRLWRTVPDTLQALVTDAPALIDTLLPGRGLFSRARAAFPGNAAWLQDLRAHVERPAPEEGGLAQEQLFEQYTTALRAISADHPLLLLLDDLQWADPGSIGLLFHLAFRLGQARLLVVGSYRPTEIALGDPFASTPSQNARHPLEKVLSELKRRLGDVWIDVSQAGQLERQGFVDALLDAEPNDLGPGFRHALLERTEGYPLFTVELLRAMQERDDLARDDAGRWVEGTALDWETLPARTEAVIEERINRLDAALRELLSAASVEGETFTAQVVAAVLGTDEGQVLRALSRQLAADHHLVYEAGEVHVDGRHLHRYRFAHVLFQHYLYGTLGMGERRLLHREVGMTLEALYTDQEDTIAVELAHHYAEAGDADKAVTHFSRAGDRARQIYALEEAIAHYGRAVAQLRELGPPGQDRAARMLMKLGLAYHTAFDYVRSRQAYEEGFQLWQQASMAVPVAIAPAPHALRLDIEPLTTGLDPTVCPDPSSYTVIGQLYSALVGLTPELDVIPDVARTWEVSVDGRTYTFHIRRDARWSDGQPVTAAEYDHALRRILGPETASPWPDLLDCVRGGRAYHKGTGEWKDVGISTLDEATLQIELAEPVSYFLHVMSMVYPAPRHVVERHGNGWARPDRLVSNGPFRLVSWDAPQSMLLERNPSYHGPFHGNVARVELCLLPDWRDRLARYEAGALDVFSIDLLPSAEIDRIRQHYANEHIRTPELTTVYAFFDVTCHPVDDPRVRRALALAIDREALAHQWLGGLYAPATGGLVPPGMPGHVKEGLPYDPERARRLLAEAGYPDGRGFPELRAVATPLGTAQSVSLQRQWLDSLGIHVHWETIARGAQPQQSPHIGVLGWQADYPDPHNFLALSSALRHTGWYDKDYEDLIARAVRALDQTERLRLYAHAERILAQEVPLVPLHYGRTHLLVKPWVRSYPTSPMGSTFWFLKDVVIETH
jgi:ABC-type oligopeptide transport system substrate-binding subunit/DNA-binding SARP family transcriptional activator